MILHLLLMAHNIWHMTYDPWHMTFRVLINLNRTVINIASLTKCWSTEKILSVLFENGLALRSLWELRKNKFSARTIEKISKCRWQNTSGNEIGFSQIPFWSTRPTHSHGVVITIFCVVCTSVLPSVPTFQNLAKQNKVQARIVIATGVNVGLAEWIIAGTRVLSVIFFLKQEKVLRPARTTKVPSLRACKRTYIATIPLVWKKPTTLEMVLLSEFHVGLRLQKYYDI